MKIEKKISRQGILRGRDDFTLLRMALSCIAHRVLLHGASIAHRVLHGASSSATHSVHNIAFSVNQTIFLYVTKYTAISSSISLQFVISHQYKFSLKFLGPVLVDDIVNEKN